jgi:hypothetical protein
VTEGALDVCVDGEWKKLRAGESVTVPAGVPHTLRNSSGAEVRLVNVHRPAMEFERMFRRMHAMIVAGRLTLPPRGLGAMLRIAMPFREHEREIVSVKPPNAVMRTFARVGRLVGIKLPKSSKTTPPSDRRLRAELELPTEAQRSARAPDRSYDSSRFSYS